MKRIFVKNLFVKNLVVKISYALFYTITSTEINAAEKKEITAIMSPIDSIIPMLSGLVVILVVIFGLAYLFKKFSGFNIASQNIRVLETQIIGHKEKIMIIKVRRQQFLIGVTAQSISQLGELETDELDDSKFEKSSRFTSNTNATKRNQNSAFSKIMSTLTYTKKNKETVANINQEIVE